MKPKALDMYKQAPIRAFTATPRVRTRPRGSEAAGNRGRKGGELADAHLPPLANDEQLEAWRHRVADSALRFARNCDVPHGMLRHCGAIALG